MGFMKNKKSSNRYSSVPGVAGKSVAATSAAAVAVAKVPVAAPAKQEAKPAAKPLVAAVDIQPICAQLQSAEPALRLAAISKLRQLADAASIPALVAALRDTDADVAREATEALASLYAASPAEQALIQRSLIAAVANGDGYFHSVVRAAAAAGLASIGSTVAVPALIAAVRDPIAQASIEAVRALGLLGDARTEDVLVGVLANADGYFLPVVRFAAIAAVGKFPTATAQAALLALADNAAEDPALRAAAQAALN